MLAASLPAGVAAQAQAPHAIIDAAVAPTLQADLPAQNPSAKFDRITPADGLSYPIVRDILQDRHGFIWFATDSGLNKYDGYSFTVYKNLPGDPTSIRFDAVSAIYEDSDGTLWVGGGGGLDRFDRATETFTHVDTRGQVFCIYEDTQGVLWVGFWHGLYGYDRAAGTIIHEYQRGPSALDEPGMLLDNAITAILEDRSGNLWIGTPSGLDLLDRATGTFTHYRHDPNDPNTLGHSGVNAILEDDQGRLWIGTGGGLNLLHRPAGTFTRFEHDPDDQHSLAHDAVISLIQDDGGALWVGTLEGLDRFEPPASAGDPELNSKLVRFTHFRHDPDDPNSLCDDLVSTLFQDRSGVLWVGTANGVCKYNRRASQFTHYVMRSEDTAGGNTRPGLSDSKIAAVAEDGDGRLWVGTFNGGLDILDPQSGDLRRLPK